MDRSSVLRFLGRFSSPAAPAPLPERALPSSQFPPHDVGIEVVPVERLLADNRDLLQRIRLSYGCDDSTFQTFVIDVVGRYARFVHLLPATPDNFFRERGGLLRMGMEIAFFALQGTDGHIFGGRQSISQRLLLEPRWRYAAFIAGLLAEVHRVFNQLLVIGDDGQTWPAYLGPLYDWTTAGRQRYFLRWTQRARENRGPALFALSHVVPAGLMEWLNQDNSVIVPQLMASVGGLPTYHETSIIDQLVRRCVAVVIDTDLRSSADRYGRPVQGAHLERYLVDAMRRLVASGAWAINGEKSRLWLGTDGLFLVWPGAATEIVRLLVEKDELPGVPKSPETLAEILVAAGAFDQAPDGSATWQILPPAASAPLNAVRLSSPTILLSALSSPPAALPEALVRPGGAVPMGDASTAAGSPVEATPAATARPSSSAEAQSQLDLVLSGNLAPAVTVPAGSPPVPPPAAAAQAFRLRSAPRLSPPVRQALTDIVATLNGPGSAAACRSISAGLFVPLRSFEARSIDPSVAVRALKSAQMLAATADGSWTRRAEFDHAQLPGVVVKICFVDGFDNRDFAQPEKDAC